MTADTFVYDKGLTAWTQVVAAHLLVMNGFGYFSSFALFESHWQLSLNRSSSDIAWVGSIQLFLLFFIGTLSGRVMDAGYFRTLLLTGCGLQLVGVFVTSVVWSYWQLVVTQGVVQGVGNGLLFTPLVALVSTYFRSYRAFALSLAACGAPIGGVIFALIARQLMPTIGFAWAVRVMGFVICFNTIVVILIARPRILPKSSGPLVEWHAFKEPVYLLFSIGIFLVLWGLYTAYFFVTSYGTMIVHVPTSASLNLLIALNAAGVAGRIVPGLLADKVFGVFNVLIPFTFASGVLLLCWVRVLDYGGYVAWAVTYGICANAVQTLFPSTLTSLTVDMSKMGVRTGMVFTVGSIACLTGAPIAGALIDSRQGSWASMQIFAGITVLMGTGLLLAARLVPKGHYV